MIGLLVAVAVIEQGFLFIVNRLMTIGAACERFVKDGFAHVYVLQIIILVVVVDVMVNMSAGQLLSNIIIFN